METLHQKLFFSKYNIDSEKFSNSGLEWNHLEQIYEHFTTTRAKYDEPAKFIFNKLMTVPCVHSVRYRIKSPEHLIEKIIRKKIANPDSDINIDNYQTKVTDLIGIRALYLFKKDWKPIHDFVLNEWNLIEKPTLYYRDGDSKTYTDELRQAECEPKLHQFGYRSIHYLIEMQPSKETFVAELQIRTIFEEAWSEIDHEIRYPYYLNHPVFLNQLLILNRLAGTADEMSTYMKELQEHLTVREKEFVETLQTKEKIIETISTKLDILKATNKNMEYAVDVSGDYLGKVALSGEEIEFMSQFFQKFNGLKTLNLDTNNDGTPDTFLINDKDKGRILAIDYDQDGVIDYYIKL